MLKREKILYTPSTEDVSNYDKIVCGVDFGDFENNIDYAIMGIKGAMVTILEVGKLGEYDVTLGLKDYIPTNIPLCIRSYEPRLRVELEEAGYEVITVRVRPKFMKAVADYFNECSITVVEEYDSLTEYLVGPWVKVPYVEAIANGLGGMVDLFNEGAYFVG